MSALAIPASLAAALVCLSWLAGALLGARTVRAIPALGDAEFREPPCWPRVSLLVPARDEAATLEAATHARLASDYPSLEIVLVDDRSRDGTGALVDALSAADPRVRGVHVTELPEGWLGKVHALARGLDASSGEWLLLTDADVHMAPGTLRLAVAHALARGLDHLVLLPRIESRGFLLDTLYSAFGRYFAVSQRLWAVEDPRSTASVGVGAFNLVRRDALQRSGGFEELRLEVTDDLALGRRLKASGGRTGVLQGRDHVWLSWYESVSDMARGLEKNAYAIMEYSLVRVVLMCTTVLAVDALPFAALALGAPWLRVLAAAALLAGAWAAVASARWAGRPALPSLVFPLGSVLLAWVFLRSGVLGALRGGIDWRGTFHASSELRAFTRR